jgi:hypothetical protein
VRQTATTLVQRDFMSAPVPELLSRQLKQISAAKVTRTSAQRILHPFGVPFRPFMAAR